MFQSLRPPRSWYRTAHHRRNIIDAVSVVSKNKNELKTRVSRGVLNGRFYVRSPRELESSVMSTMIQPLTLSVVAVAGWIQRDQQAAIVYLLGENRVLKARLRGRKLRLTNKGWTTR